jgi:glycosyltransferase involved in cell wall biosynthesis
MSRPLRFVMLTTFYPPYSFGGDAIYVERLASALGSAGHTVDIIHCIDSYHLLHPGSPEGVAVENPNVTVHGLRSRAGRLSPLLTQQTGWPFLKQAQIRQILNRSRPDVIHYHNTSLFGPGVLALNPDTGSPLKVYTTHEYWLVCPTHILWKFNSRACEKPECLRCVAIAKRPPQIWRYTGMIDRYAKQVDLFLAPSRFAAEMHSQRGFKMPMTYLPLFVETKSAPDEDNSPSPHPRPYFLFVGRLEAIKDPASLIAAWHKVPEADLLIAGAGSDMQMLIALTSGNDRIRFLGYVAQSELEHLYRHCLACIVPSQMLEVFPLVVLEAFAHKAPVVARDRGPLAEMIADSGGGLLYHTEGQLIEDLSRLVYEPELRKELGENGYRIASTRWTKEAHLDRYFALLRDASVRRFGRVSWDNDGCAL